MASNFLEIIGKSKTIIIVVCNEKILLNNREMNSFKIKVDPTMPLPYSRKANAIAHNDFRRFSKCSAISFRLSFFIKGALAQRPFPDA
ncbi:MAG: hypothetical protein AB1351_02650, partial [Thermoproteota archaeon]